MGKTYNYNLSTGRIELNNLTHEEYKQLEESIKKKVKSYFLFSKSNGCWVSKSTQNHWSAKNICKQLGFIDCIEIGEIKSFSQELNDKVSKAENRSNYYNNKANKCLEKAEELKNILPSYEDVAFWTQPNINSSKGRSFTNYRKKLIDRADKRFEEYRKSEYFKEKSNTSSITASMENLKDKDYIYRKIEENEKLIRKLEKNDKLDRSQEILYLKTIDKLAFYSNKLDELGGIQFSKENIKVGMNIKLRNRIYKVVKANIKTVGVKIDNDFTLKYKYSEIQQIV